MKRKNKMRILALVLVLVMSVGLFASCAKEAKVQSTVPLVVGYRPFNEKFSSLFATTAYDQAVSSIVGGGEMLTLDRAGGIVFNAIKGETIEYEGIKYDYKGIADLKIDYDEAANITTYTWTLSKDVKFSDGVQLTADDVIFSYYIYLDPTYDGGVTLFSVNIVGLQNYRTQTTSEVYEKYFGMFDDIYAGNGNYTAEMAAAAESIVREVWIADVQAIVDYCLTNYMGYAEAYTGYTAEEITGNTGMEVMFGMIMWGFGAIEDDGSLTGAATGNSWDLVNEFPTVEDYYEEFYLSYDGDPVDYWNTENPDMPNIYETARGRFILEVGSEDESLGGGGIPNIEGIKKLSSNVVEVKVEGFDAAAVYQMGPYIVPLHYYGDTSKYDYDNNKFGLDFGDLSGVKAKTTQPLGYGPYKFIRYENKIVYLEANETYYKGRPITTYVQLMETQDADMISGVGAGTIDIAEPSFSSAAVDEISSYNSNGETTGDSIMTTTVDNRGYGYVGINAKSVSVGGVSDSAESKALRSAFATIFAVYRDFAVDSYYGERATVIDYPISNTSWAAPRKSDADYEVAYSRAIDGSEIYTSDMNADAKYDAALAAAIDYFIAAGYTYDGRKFTAAPAGASLEYEIMIPADGIGDHPSFYLVTKVSEVLGTIGINLIINDLTDSSLLWDAIDAGSQELWCAAWLATADPDMYQVYYSNNVVGNPGSTESNHYHIQDPELDELMMSARASEDQNYRKTTYKACLDIILEWAVEVPIYQRKNCVIFSSERIDISSVELPATFYEWWKTIEKIDMIVAE